MAGQPTKLTPQIQQNICDLLRAGNFVETVCDHVGIDDKTFYNWYNWGKRGEKKDREAGYAEFFHAVKRAIAQVEIETVADVRGGPLNWQSKAWWLERRHPDRWGNRQRQEIKHSGQVTTLQTTLEEWRKQQANSKQKALAAIGDFDE